MTPRTIPQIRERLLVLAAELGCPELAALAHETRRRPPVRQAPRRAQYVTPELQAAIVAHAAMHPTESMRSIGRRFGVDQGRVSEAIAGKRGEA